MCGACPGGARLSDATRFLGLHGGRERATRLLVRLTGGRAAISQLGDGWSVRLPTGALLAVNSFEELVRACARVIDTEQLSSITPPAHAGAHEEPTDPIAALVGDLSRAAVDGRGGAGSGDAHTAAERPR